MNDDATTSGHEPDREGAHWGADEGDFLRCPNCGLSFELTWRRYVRAPFGRHSCPFCRAPFRLKRTFASYLPVFAATFVIEIAVLWAAYLVLRDFGAAMIIAVMAASVVVLPLDKRLDARLGKPMPRDEKRRQRPL